MQVRSADGTQTYPSSVQCVDEGNKVSSDVVMSLVTEMVAYTRYTYSTVHCTAAAAAAVAQEQSMRLHAFILAISSN